MPPSHVERLHILSLQLDGTHGASLSTFYVPFCQEAPCVFQARACAIKYSKHSHFHSWCNWFLWDRMYVHRYVGMYECVHVCSPESLRESQRDTGRPREVQRAYSTCVCGEAQSGRAWIEQGCHALGRLAGGLAGWLTPRGLRRALGLQLSGMCCVVLSSGSFEPRGKLGIQLSVMYGLVFC